MMDNMINDTRLEAQIDAAASGYTPDKGMPAEVWAAIAGDQAQQYINDDDCYDHTSQPDDQQQVAEDFKAVIDESDAEFRQRCLAEGKDPDAVIAESQIQMELGAVISDDGTDTSSVSSATQTQNQTQTMQQTMDIIVHWDMAIDKYFDARGGSLTYDQLADKETATEVRRAVIANVATSVDLDNAVRQKGHTIAVPQSLDLHAVGEIMMRTGDIATTETVSGGGRIIIIRHHTGPMAGTWEMDADPKHHNLRRVADMLGLKPQFKTMLADHIMDIAPTVQVDTDHDIVPMANGILDLRTNDFTPYTRDNGEENQDYVSKYGQRVIVRKAAAAWDDNAQDTTLIGPDGLGWSVEQHLRDVLGGNDAAVTIFWQACNFALRGISGGRTLWFMDSSENGGGGGAKSTTAAMIGALIGPKYTANLNVDKLQERFGLAGIIGKTLIIGNESNAGTKAVENAATIKALMRNEPVLVERKGQDVLEYRFDGLMIQCFNCTAPRFSDKTGSFYRKICAIPFGARLGGKTERRYIADDFISRPEVIAYIARKALDLGAIERYDESALAALDGQIVAMRAAGSTVYAYCEEYMHTLAGEMIPVAAFYAAYGRWCRANGYNGCSASSFEADLQQWMASNSGYELVSCGRGEPPKRMPSSAPPEQFLAEWGTEEWRRDIDIRKTSLDEGAGAWSLSKLRTPQRKWIHNLTVGRKDAADMPYTTQVRKYRDFVCQYMAYMATEYAKYGTPIDPGKIPSMDRWIELGRPVARYIDAPLEPSGYQIAGWQSYDLQRQYNIRLENGYEGYVRED